MKYVDCTVTIEDDARASYTDSYGKSEQDAVLSDELVDLAIERVRYWINTNACGREDLALLGRCLYKLLFHDKMRKHFESTFLAFKRELEQDPDARLRLILVFDRKAKELAKLPWEFIFMPSGDDKGFFLAGERTDLILTRFAARPDQDRRRFDPEEAPLRILVVLSRPRELGAVDPGDAVKEIHKLEGAVVKTVEKPMKSVLQTEIESFKPHVLHFIGHGQAGKIALFRDESEIEDDELKSGERREALWVNSQTLSSMFTNVKPRLVFLHACKGAETFPTSLASFTSTARDLVYSDIPAVVGMQYEIENEDAAQFAKTFYAEIAKGKPIDEAVSAGRRALGLGASESWGDRRFGTPVVYLQSKDPIVLAHAAAEAAVPSADLEWFPCPYGAGCRSQVTKQYKRCLDCRKPLKLCPECGYVMGASPGMGCPNCPYVEPIEPAAVSTAAAATTQANVVPLERGADDVAVG
jgi:hypothetical protein